MIESRDVVNVAAAGRPKIYTQPEIHRPYFNKLDSFLFRNLISASSLKEVDMFNLINRGLGVE